jgi:hypothetical protein
MATSDLSVQEIEKLGEVERTEEVKMLICQALNTDNPPEIRIAGINAAAASLKKKNSDIFTKIVVKTIDDPNEKVQSVARKLLRPYKDYWYKVAAKRFQREHAKPPKPVPLKRRKPY